jgi:hypothetical protein
VSGIGIVTRDHHCTALLLLGDAAMNLDSLRKRLSSKGLTPARAVPQGPGERTEDSSISPATLVEGRALVAFEIALRTPWPEPVGYLDSIQRLELVGYLGSSSIFIGEIGAAVRVRRNRRLSTLLEDHRLLALARPQVLAAAGDVLEGLEPVPLPDDDPPHPIRDLITAGRALDQARGTLELRVGDRYRANWDAWLVVDGVLSESPHWAADARMVAISKSHSMLPFAGLDLEQYLRLPAGHRSSIYQPVTRSLAPVRSWGLRLWPWQGHDLLHGLVRVEVAPSNGRPDVADEISRWILADRAPISAPDRRWDRLLYGISSVEQYLRAR